MATPPPHFIDPQPLLARLRAFLFPGGEDAARHVHGIRTRQHGEFRASPGARGTKFTASEFVDATRSSFRWEARIGTVVVTDAYENSHGLLSVKLGGIVPLQKIAGPEADQGELQRYLAAVIYCPPMVLNHQSLEWTALGPLTFRLRDRLDPTGATVELECGEDGHPIVCRAQRPRTVGKRFVLTPWLARATDFREIEGIRVPFHLEADWNLPEGAFTYFHGKVTAYSFVRKVL